MQCGRAIAASDENSRSIAEANFCSPGEITSPSAPPLPLRGATTVGLSSKLLCDVVFTCCPTQERLVVSYPTTGRSANASATSAATTPNAPAIDNTLRAGEFASSHGISPRTKSGITIHCRIETLRALPTSIEKVKPQGFVN